MIPILDARSGTAVKLLDVVRYPGDPEASWKLLAVWPGLFSATLVIMDAFGQTQRVRAPIRWFHPGAPEGAWRVVIAPT